ncbi:MAG: hypothetical protein HYY30_13075 [Chloroflexi bacterium]|nr:hypothetical protein [Chloroflexota bacterium]
MAEREKRRSEGERLDEMGEQFRARMDRLVPAEFRRHMMAANREFLLAIRSLLDTQIERLDRKEKEAGRKATRVNVE